MTLLPESAQAFDAGELSFDTVCAGLGRGRRDGEPLLTPIYQTTTFCRDGIESTAEHRYSRESNPTVAALEQAFGDLEQALPALCFTTGLAAEAALLLGTCKAGDHVICARAVYGGTTRLLRDVLANLGIAATFVDTTDASAVADALAIPTRLVLLETPANPTLDVTDLRSIASLAKAHGALVAVDNTFLTPVLQRPLDLGCDVSIYSTTKFVEGHSAALGGALVTNDAELRERIAFVRKCTGAIQTPFNAWLTLQGVKTLPLRIRRQSQTAAALAEWLDQHPAVATTHYPTLGDAARQEIAFRQHDGGHGAVVSFELHGGMSAAHALLRGVTLPRLAEHVGSVDTLLTHPASMTHGGLSAAQRAAAGIPDGLLRLSVGVEAPEDLRRDLAQALESLETESCHTRPEAISQ